MKPKEYYIQRTNELFLNIKNDPVNMLTYRNSIVEINLPLVSSVLKKYKPYTDDQFQAACIGLVVSTDTYNPTLGVPFHNYACFCIERELHKLHFMAKKSIETRMKDDFVYLDALVQLDSDEDSVRQEELIADLLAEEAFREILREHSLEKLFNTVIIPCIEEVGTHTKGQNAKCDLRHWITLEIRYILELAQFDSQKYRLNFSKMSKILGISIQNIRMRHARVANLVRKRINMEDYAL